MRSEDGLVRPIILEYMYGSTRIKVERPVQKVIVLVPVDESGEGEHNFIDSIVLGVPQKMHRLYNVISSKILNLTSFLQYLQ